jgi:hypothetical protein
MRLFHLPAFATVLAGFAAAHATASTAGVAHVALLRQEARATVLRGGQRMTFEFRAK